MRHQTQSHDWQSYLAGGQWHPATGFRPYPARHSDVKESEEEIDLDSTTAVFDQVAATPMGLPCWGIVRDDEGSAHPSYVAS